MLVIAKFTYSQVVYSDIKDVLDILKNASAMIFTIVGIWIAYIYPNAITAIVNPDSISVVAGERDAKRIEMLVGVILSSAFVIAGIVVFFVVKTLLGNTATYANNINCFKPVGIAVVFHLAFLQLTALVKVGWSNYLFINDLHSKINKKKLANEE